MTVQERLNKTKEVYAAVHTTSGASMFYDAPSAEHSLLEWATEMLETAGAYVIRNAWSTRRGVADLTVCFAGKFIALELKDDEGEPTKQQLKHLDKVRKAGGLGRVCRTLSEIYDCLQEASL